jgi:hypothetical protein
VQFQTHHLYGFRWKTKKVGNLSRDLTEYGTLHLLHFLFVVVTAQMVLATGNFNACGLRMMLLVVADAFDFRFMAGLSSMSSGALPCSLQAYNFLLYLGDKSYSIYSYSSVLLTVVE